MKRLATILIVPALVSGSAFAATAERMTVTPQVKAGLHEQKSLDSPITKLVGSGTELEIIKREDTLSFVREPEGTTGWIDNSYLGSDAGGATGQLKEALDRADVLERRLAEAQQQIADLSAGKGATSVQSGTDSQRNETLKKQSEDAQQLKEERLKSGELQVQLAELKKRLGVNNDNESLYQRILDLETENKRLELTAAGATGTEGSATSPSASSPAASGITLPAGNLATILVFAVLAGLLAGLYLMDFLNRRRHGGFRV